MSAHCGIGEDGSTAEMPAPYRVPHMDHDQLVAQFEALGLPLAGCPRHPHPLPCGTVYVVAALRKVLQAYVDLNWLAAG